MVLSTLREVTSRYKGFVTKQPLVVAELESALRWMSYLASASKYNESHVLSEFLFTASNILQLLNDNILRKAAKIVLSQNRTVEYLKTMLQVLEYTSGLSEFAANRYATTTGRWIIIAVYQVSKCIIKLLLLLRFRQGIQTPNPYLPLDRRVDLNGLSQQQKKENETIPSPGSSSNESETMTLQRSGRVMRTLDTAPCRNQRTWKVPGSSPEQTAHMESLMDRNRKDAPPSPLTDAQVLAEVMHIIRPTVHLGAMATFGTQSWLPYLMSMGMDVTSLKLLHEPHDKLWNLKESIELGQRSFSLLLYLMRSPVFDLYTKEKMVKVISLFANNTPLIGRFIQPMVTYLPEWQRTYFYVWGS